MLGTIYHITNKLNGKKYIGKTTNYPHRVETHLSDLRLGKHHSIKLQRAYNKYGEENFIFTHQEFEVKDDDELSILEMKEIAKYDSRDNGYNITLGGEGWPTALDYDTRVIVYQILQRYDGVQRKLSKFFHCSADVFRDLRKNHLYKKLPYSEEKVQALIQELGLTDKNLVENYVSHNERKLTKENCLEILSVITYSEGYDKTLCAIFGVNSKLTYNLRRKKIYKDYIAIFETMSPEEKEELRLKAMKKYDLEHQRAMRGRRCVKNPLTQEQVNYILDNRDKKTRVKIAKELGVSADRVGQVALEKSYKDLIAIYYASRETK